MLGKGGDRLSHCIYNRVPEPVSEEGALHQSDEGLNLKWELVELPWKLCCGSTWVKVQQR